MCNCIPFLVFWSSDLAGWSGTWKKIIGKLIMQRLEKEECGNISQNGPEFVKIFAMSYQSKPQQRRILIIKQMGWLILWLSVNLFPQPLLSFQWAHEQNSHGGRWCIVSAIWTSIHQGWTDYSHCWMPIQAAAENNIEYLLWHHSPGEWAGYQICRLSILDCFHHGRDNLTGIDMNSGYRFTFPTYNASANSAVHSHIECTVLSTAFHK